MAYGIRATASGGQFQIDSSLTGTKHLAVSVVGTVAAGGQLTIGSQELLFVRGPSAAPGVGINFNSTGTVATFHSSQGATDYVLCRPSDSSSHTGAINATDYGIQVKNASGAVCFDSRAVVKGLTIVSVIAKNAMAGGDPGIAGYNGSANTVFAGSAGTFDSTNAAYRKLYVSCGGAQFTPNVLSGTSHSAFTFDYSGNKIFYKGFVSFNVGGQVQLPYRNQSEILVGELFE